jgi:hypothetical protein
MSEEASVQSGEAPEELTDSEIPSVEEMFARIQANGMIADKVRGLLVASARLVARDFSSLAKEDWPPMDGSAYAGDREVVLDERYGSVADLVRNEARLDLHTVADTLSGYAALVETQSSFVGAVAVGRAVYESSIWASSVMDPAVGADVRAQRALTRRLARLHATRRHKVLLGPVAGTDTDPEQGHDPDREEIEHILALVEARKWKVIKGQYAPSIGTKLSIEKLAPTLPGTMGVEDYAWGSSSSMIHGEQPGLAQSWITFGFDQVPAWLTGVWTSGVPFGTRIGLATTSGYLGVDVGYPAWEMLHKTWDIACSQPGGWRF